jgi:NAD(P)-dependent dehydrogenase (short-subunit alcohol dehydrogenase family)
MSFPVEPRVVITGAGSGLGRALALKLAARRARILIADPDERQRQMAGNLFKRSPATADDVATVALDGLEAGALYIVPHVDGKLAWRLKRLHPELYFASMRALFYSLGLDRQLLE